jgi:hypothetical protein
MQLPNDADLNKVMNFVEKVWRRLLRVRPHRREIVLQFIGSRR